MTFRIVRIRRRRIPFFYHIGLHGAKRRMRPAGSPLSLTSHCRKLSLLQHRIIGRKCSRLRSLPSLFRFFVSRLALYLISVFIYPHGRLITGRRNPAFFFQCIDRYVFFLQKNFLLRFCPRLDDRKFIKHIFCRYPRIRYRQNCKNRGKQQTQSSLF